MLHITERCKKGLSFEFKLIPLKRLAPSLQVHDDDDWGSLIEGEQGRKGECAGECAFVCDFEEKGRVKE